MSHGYLIYAFNTPHYDYVKLAEYNAKNIARFTGYPVALVTDTDSKVSGGVFSHVIRKAPQVQAENLGADRTLWRNTERTGYLEDTPFTRTIVLDADYLIFNNQLNQLFNVKESLILSEDTRQLSGGALGDSRISDFGINTVWATCFVFEASQLSVDFFQTVDYVKSHYEYFANLYDFSPEPLRNDFAFSIAKHLLSGSDSQSSSVMLNPYPIYLVNRTDPIYALKDDGVLVRDSHHALGFVRTKGMNIHILSKPSLMKCVQAVGEAL